MKAAILHQPGSALTIEEISVSTPGPREVLIRTRACGVCHSDLHFIDGVYPAPLPFLPGHEAAGVVEAVGDDVTAIRPGDHVVTCFSTFCGRCEFCVTGRLSLCVDASTKRKPTERAAGGARRQRRSTSCSTSAAMPSSCSSTNMARSRSIRRCRSTAPR